jgi:membrane protease YdiL (CAAX protease family)
MHHPPMAGTATPSTLYFLGWAALVVITLALLPLGHMQRKMLREGRLSSLSMPRAGAYRSAALQWLVLGALALWLVQQSPSPFGGSAYAWPDGAEGLLAFAVVAAVLLGLLRWRRRLDESARERAWLRSVYRFGASLIAPRGTRELAQFRLMAVLTSSAEEITYRLAVPGGFALLLGGGEAAAWPAAVLSALLFGIAHAWQGAWVMFWTMVFGLVAAALMLGTGSVWPAVALHIGWNFIVGGMMHAVYGRHLSGAAAARS